MVFADVLTQDRNEMEGIRVKGQGEWNERGFKGGQKIAAELSPLPPPRRPPPVDPPAAAPQIAPGVVAVAVANYEGQGARPRVRQL